MAHPILQKYGIQEEEKQHPILQKYGIQEEKQHPILAKYGIAKPVTPTTTPIPTTAPVSPQLTERQKMYYPIEKPVYKADIARQAVGESLKDIGKTAIYPLKVFDVGGKALGGAYQWLKGGLGAVAGKPLPAGFERDLKTAMAKAVKGDKDLGDYFSEDVFAITGGEKIPEPKIVGKKVYTSQLPPGEEPLSDIEQIMGSAKTALPIIAGGIAGTIADWKSMVVIGKIFRVPFKTIKEVPQVGKLIKEIGDYYQLKSPVYKIATSPVKEVINKLLKKEEYSKTKKVWGDRLKEVIKIKTPEESKISGIKDIFEQTTVADQKGISLEIRKGIFQPNKSRWVLNDYLNKFFRNEGKALVSRLSEGKMTLNDFQVLTTHFRSNSIQIKGINSDIITKASQQLRYEMNLPSAKIKGVEIPFTGKRIIIQPSFVQKTFQSIESQQLLEKLATEGINPRTIKAAEEIVALITKGAIDIGKTISPDILPTTIPIPKVTLPTQPTPPVAEEIIKPAVPAVTSVPITKPEVAIEKEISPDDIPVYLKVINDERLRLINSGTREGEVFDRITNIWKTLKQGNTTGITQTTIGDAILDIGKLAQEAPAIPKAKAPSSLVEEAKKHKTAEEFVKAQPKFYHGTDKSFAEFNESRRGTTTKSKSSEKAFFFSSSLETATSYAEGARYLRGNTKLDVLEKEYKRLDSERRIGAEYDRVRFKELSNELNKIRTLLLENVEGANIRVVSIAPKNPKVIDMKGLAPGEWISKNTEYQNFGKYLENLKKQGYDVLIYNNSFEGGSRVSNNIAVFDKNILKTKSDLTSIWEQAHKPQQPKAEAPSSLVEEAKKHKTAEEFVGGYTPVFRASDKSFDITLIGEEGMFVSPSENIAGFFGEGGKRPVEKLFISPNAKFLEWKDIPEKLTDFSGKDIKKIHVGIKEYAESKGYDIVSHEPQAGYPKGIELQIINPDVIKTRSDLTSIWEQAHKKVTLPEEQQMGLPITETLPLEERASLLERAGYTEEAEKLRRTAIKTSREITLDIEGKEKQTEFITQQENTMKEVLQSPNKYGISEEQLELFPDEVEVANGSQKIQKTNRIETARDIRNIHSTSPIHHKETSKIAQEIESRGFIDYRGKEVNSPQEIAELATAFRHPKMEQLQVFYLKGKKVVAHRIISSGAPAHVTTDHKLFYKIKNAAGRLGADGIYLAHNHPSGDPTPSKQDIGFTAFMEYNNRLIKGHIVTNSDKYSLIEKSYPEAFKHIERWKATEHTFKETQKDYRRGLTLISTSENVAAQTKDFIQGNKLSIVFMDSQNKIMSIDNIGIDKDIRQYIIEVIRARGAVRYIISHSTAIKPPKVKYPPGILDYVMVDPETGVYSDKSISFPKEISIEQAPPSKGKYYGIQEKPAEYHPEAKEIEPKKLKEKIGQPVKSSAIQKKYEKIEDAWFGNKDVEAVRASVEANKAQEAIRKTTREKRFGQQSKNIDKAIQIYIDLKRNPTHYDKFINELTPEQQRIVNLSQNLSKEQKAIADEISKQYSEVGLKSKEAEVIRNTIDNYVARVWDVAPPKRGTEVGRKFGVTTRHAKARTFETIVEGWANKYTLKIEGATNNLAILKEEMNNVIQDKKFLNLISKLKDVEGNPIISTTQLEGYARVEHPNFKQWKFAGQATPEDLRGRNFFQTPEGTILERKELYAPEKLAQDLNNIMGVSKLKGIKAIDVITKYNAVVKAWVLQTSFFHHVAFMRSFYLGSAPFGEIKIGKGFIESLKDLTPRQSYKTGLEAINNFTPEIELLVKNGLTLGKIQDWEESILRNEDFFIGKMLDKYKATKAIKDKINLFRENQAKFLFQQFGAGLKAKAALIELKNILKKHPNMETNKAAKMAANLTNDDFGGLHLKRLKRNPTVQHIFRIFALAPDWTESNIRSMVKAFKTGQEGKVYRRFWARILTKGILATLIANVLLGGDDWWENYKKAWKSGWNKLRWLDVDITPIYKLFGGETEARKYFSILGHFKDPLKFAIDPIQAAHYKGSMVYGAIFEAITGEDWAGRTFTSLDELVKTGETVKYAPFTAKPQKYTTIPSYTIAQLKGSQPVQFQQLLSWWAGETEGFDSIANSLGFGVRTTYPPKKKKSKYGVQFKKSKKETHPILKKYGIK